MKIGHLISSIGWQNFHFHQRCSLVSLQAWSPVLIHVCWVWRLNQMTISLIFMFSFSITLMLLGFLSSFLGEQVLMWNETYGSSLYFLLAGIFIVLGCYILGLRMHHFLHRLPVRFILFYTKQEPHKGQTLVHPKLKASSLGFLFGLTPSPCTTPMILAMLAYTMMKGSVLLGSVLLFAYGIGHGMPFLLMAWMSDAMKRSRWMTRWHRLFYKFVGAFYASIV
jgi:cytochrome c-type biogenesis protein